jgi:hypothetical protein
MTVSSMTAEDVKRQFETYQDGLRTAYAFVAVCALRDGR